MQKHVYIDRRARKELAELPRSAQLRFRGLFTVLTTVGKLEPPFAKKMAGLENIFEIRVKYQGQWRALYTYQQGNTIIILSVFYKNTQKTARKELETAIRRKKDYEN